MKKNKYLILTIILLSLGFSCSEDFVDGGSPVDQITDAGFWLSETNYIGIINACYNEFEWFEASGDAWVTHANYPTNDMNTGAPYDMISRYTSTGPYGGIWTTFYQVIHNINQIDKNLELNESFSQSAKDRIEGEAMFLRGFSYLNLVRAFGGVPIILTPNSASADKDLARSSKEETLAQVVADLTVAVNKMPEKWSDIQGYDVGRPLKGSALAYRMMAYMYQEDWDKAIADAQAIMGLSRGYKLLDNVRDVFTVANENSAESMFEINYFGSDGGWLRPTNNQFLGEETIPRGIGTQYSKFGGWGAMWPRKDMVESFEPGDLRREKLFLAMGETYVGEFFTEPFVFTEATRGGVIDGYVCTKYWPGNSGNPGPGGEQNLPQLRFADVLINYAECLMRKDNLAGAYEQLNKVRTRAGISDKSPSTAQQCLKDITQERRLETFLEPNLWWEMVRSGVAANFLQETYGIVMDSKWELAPIPQSEMDSNKLLEQNPGGY